jgi:hypothetical protein
MKPNQLIMRKIVRKQLIAISSLLTLLCLASGLQAQCNYKVINRKSDTLSIAIPSDFPAMEKGGTAAANSTAFWQAFDSWTQSSEALRQKQLPTASTTGILKIYFEIPAAVYASFTEERKLALAAYPQFYVVLP